MSTNKYDGHYSDLKVNEYSSLKVIIAVKTLITVFFIVIFCNACQSASPTLPEENDLTSAPFPTNTSLPTSNSSPTITPSNTWIITFEGPNYGAFFDAVLTEDGNVLAVGATNHLHAPPYSGDALFMKLTLDGDVLWEQIWGGDGYEQAWATANVGDGGFYVFGETDSYGVGDRDFFLLKITEDGSEEWFQTYGKANREWPYGMLRLSNGDLLLYGFTESLVDRGRNQFALRVATNGEVIWEYTAESSEEELVSDAIETAEGDLVLAVIIEEDGALVRLDADGNLQWEKRYELAGWMFASQVIQTDAGGFPPGGFFDEFQTNRWIPGLLIALRQANWAGKNPLETQPTTIMPNR